MFGRAAGSSGALLILHLSAAAIQHLQMSRRGTQFGGRDMVHICSCSLPYVSVLTLEDTDRPTFFVACLRISVMIEYLLCKYSFFMLPLSRLHGGGLSSQ